MSNICFACQSDFKRNEKEVSCFICVNKHHPRCVGISEETAKKIIDGCCVKFVCKHCQKLNIQQQFAKIQEKLNTCLEKIDEQNSNVNLLNELLESSPNNGHVKMKYSSVLKKKNEVIVIKPKNEKQNCQQTQKEMKDKIDLNKIAVGVDRISNITKGGVAINCSNKDSKDKLKSTVKKELGNKYEVSEPKPLHPRIIVVGTESEIIKKDNDTILESFITQNDLEIVDENIRSKLKVQRKFVSKNKQNYGNIILDVHSDIYKKIMELRKFNIGWKRCDIYDYINVIRCYKCAGFNHFARDCTSKVTCSKCAGEHKLNECNNDITKCVNCFNNVMKYKINIDFYHSANDLDCPCYKRILEKIKSKVDYE